MLSWLTMKPRTDTPFLLPKDSEAQPLYKNEDPGVRTDLRYVQGLRFVTALWILVNHFLSNDDLPEWATNLIFARPVNLFVLISGLVTHMAYARREDIGGCLHFMCKRASKVLFSYWGTGLVMFLLVEFSKSYRGAPAHEHWLHLLSFVLFLLGLSSWFCIALLFFPADVNSLGLGGIFDSPGNIDNLPLWFIQSLIFCWFTYPLGRKLLPGARASRLHNLLVLAGLYIVGLLPTLIVCAIDNDECAVPPDGARVSSHFMHWNVVKYWPPFMLAPFYMGAVTWDLFLYEQEQALASESRPEWHKYATALGEALCVVFLLFVSLVRLPYLFQYYAWTILFAAVLFLFAVANISPEQSARLGLKHALELESLVFLGEWSLLVYALQAPVGTLFYWTTGNGLRELSPWRFMGPIGFVIFAPTVFALSYVVWKYIDQPVSKWLSEKIRDVTEPISDLLKF